MIGMKDKKNWPAMGLKWLAGKGPATSNLFEAAGLVRSSHNPSLIQPRGDGLPCLPQARFWTWLRSGKVIMKATGTPSSSATRTRSALTSGFSFLAV